MNECVQHRFSNIIDCNFDLNKMQVLQTTLLLENVMVNLYCYRNGYCV